MASNRRLLLLPGDGIGPECMAEVSRAIAWLEKRRIASFEVEEDLVGGAAIDAHGVPLADETLDKAMAADAVLLASGTATLEALLLKKPMVVAYRFSKLTVALIETFRLMKIDHYSLPNLLAGRRLVPEYYQQDVRPEVLGPAVLEQLDDDVHRTHLVSEFDAIHRELRRGADQLAADAVLATASG